MFEQILLDMNFIINYLNNANCDVLLNLFCLKKLNEINFFKDRYAHKYFIISFVKFTKKNNVVKFFFVLLMFQKKIILKIL